ncbi:hypothetical protein AYO38_03305 [bacterium SCGC AG-212-C10]|nr:hypothetical protein AYO38_03305 [bacterium SCGC AG-212-C10]
MAYEQILAENRGRVTLITLNRPEKLNAWTNTMMAEMRQAIDAANADPEIGAIVVTGAGRAFCAGADIAGFAATRAAMDAGKASDEGNAARTDSAENWVSFIRNSAKPTIAAVNGVCVGIGITQIMPFDIRIASTDARIGFFFVRMGLVPELASSGILAQMVGSSRAMEWCLSGRMIPAAEAKEAGLISEVTEADALVDRAIALGESLSGQSPYAMRSIRELIYQNALEPDVLTIMQREGKALTAARMTWEHKEAITAFMEKRPANFAKKPAEA